MKKHSKLISIIVVCVIFGVVVGIQLNTMMGGEPVSPYKNEIEAQELIELKKTTEDMKIKIADSKNQVEELEEKRAEESIPLKKLKMTVDEYKLLAGYSPVSGPGIIITLGSNTETNVAGIMEGKRYLINLINELRVFGAEVLSINDYRIVGRTEIVLAGNHINVNGISIEQPYTIRAVGNQESFKQYVEHGTIMFELMELDDITCDIKYSDNIEIPPLTNERPLEYVEMVDE